MALFTFITDYRGGTYIHQTQADNVSRACEIWADAVAKHDGIPDLKRKKFLKAVATELLEFSPTPIKDTTNVWCISMVLGKKLMLVNIVKTEKARAARPLRQKTAAV